MYTSTQTLEKLINSNNLVCSGITVTYLYLIVDVPSDKNYIGRYRIILLETRRPIYDN